MQSVDTISLILRTRNLVENNVQPDVRIYYGLSRVNTL